MSNNIDLPKNKELARQVIDGQNELDKIKIQKELDKIKIERGWLGQFWGNSESTPNNIAALTILLLLLTGIIYTLCATILVAPDKISLPIKDFWSIIAPLITLSIGYLFGNKAKSNEE
jgi:hypothetical protein